MTPGRIITPGLPVVEIDNPWPDIIALVRTVYAELASLAAANLTVDATKILSLVATVLLPLVEEVERLRVEEQTSTLAGEVRALSAKVSYLERRLLVAEGLAKVMP